MATKRHIKHELYLDFHAALQKVTPNHSNRGVQPSGNFNDRERRFFKWFIVVCLAGVAVMLGLNG